MANKKTVLDVAAPHPKKDREEMFDLISKVFSGHKNYYQWQRFLRETYIDPAHYDWTCSRIGKADGKIVTHYGVWDYQMRVGGAKLRTGGIGAVATDGDYRRRGLMAQTVPGSIEAMRKAGYHFSILFGLRNFYHQFGYVQAWATPTYKIWYGDLPHEKAKGRVRSFKPKRREDIEKMYNREHRGLTGTAVRPTYRNYHNTDDCEAVLWSGKGNKLAGYIFFKPGGQQLHILESGGDVEQTLRIVADLMRKHRADEAVFPMLPWDHKLARRLLAMDCRLEKRYEKCGGPMMRTINLPEALRAMSPELSKRLNNSPLSDWSGKVRIRDARETATLHATGGKVTLADDNSGRADINLTGDDNIAQILIGSEAPDEIILRHGMKMNGKNAAELMAVLFPDQHPILRRPDFY